MKLFQRFLTVACLSIGILAFSGCTSLARLEQDKESVANPLVNDIYALRCPEFFTYNNSKARPYCLARVTRVTDKYVYIISSDEVYESRSQALEHLRASDYTMPRWNIDWDVTDEVRVSRSRLLDYLKSGDLLETRRLTDSEAYRFITEISARPIK